MFKLKQTVISGSLFLISLVTNIAPLIAAAPRQPDQTVECELLIVGGGLAGTAAAFESLRAGLTVCMTELTDWVGGQISSQGTSALDEAKKQRALGFYPRGYNEFRERIEKKYGRLNPGQCWVSVSCFLPEDAHKLLWEELKSAEKQGKGKLHWFPSTVIKELELNSAGNMIDSAIAIQHSPAPNTPPLNTDHLSAIIEDAYTYQDSDRLQKKIIKFIPKPRKQPGPADWFVLEATETGEIIALADIPYRLGLDPVSHLNPSSASKTGDPYCTQGFTYTFAMEHTAEPQDQEMPSFYPQYEPYYSFEKSNFNFEKVFTYRRIWSTEKVSGIEQLNPGDISMQNWTWGNDYRPGTSQDNLIYTRRQLEEAGQLDPGGWLGGLRTETLHKGEENAIGFYYWLVKGTTDSQLGDGVKTPNPNNLYLSGLDSPMGTEHGLSKYPYIREGRRIIGRPSFGYENGFSMDEIDISKVDYRDPYYAENLPPAMYRKLWLSLAGLETVSAIIENKTPDQITRRSRSTIYPDAVGIAQYAIDFHPCMTLSPHETPGNTEREGARRSHGQAYPAQIPLRALIPQQIDNLLVSGKSIANSHIAAAAYRVHSFEWSVGAAAGTTVAFAFERGILPYQLVESMPRSNRQLQDLQQRLVKNGNPIAFPDTSIFNLDWEDWRVW
jgi:hypothetical protein